MSKIIYTKTDEAPALATRSLFPIIRFFTQKAGIVFEIRDISLASRILSKFPECEGPGKPWPDHLKELGEWVKQPDANVIKLPNISASVSQLKAAIQELQKKGYQLPDYPENPEEEKQKDIRARYDKVKGSAVNPVIREGNSDRRAPKSVKEYARKHPHLMGKWNPDSKTHVSTMSSGDFRANEKSVVISAPGKLKIEWLGADGSKKILKEGIEVKEGEIVDGTMMSRKALVSFLEAQIADAKAKGLLFSLHMKATMMKVSDPIIFGHAVKVFFADVFRKHESVLKEIGVDANNGFGDLVSKLPKLPAGSGAAVESDIKSCLDNGPALAMVNSSAGITNLHVTSDVIIDASMPAMIRTSGQMYDKNGHPKDTNAVIPDSSYAPVYQTVIDDCIKKGAYDPKTMGSVSNVGLMAQAAEEYGSHDKTFEISQSGTIRILDENGNSLIGHAVETGDIWRMCQVKDSAIKDWVKLAVNRARASGAPAVFWLGKERQHDARLIEKVEKYLKEFDTKGLEIHILSLPQATQFSLDRIREGKDTISVSGNVLRDYLTDLFPILEVGTSAKMLSIVPLMNGGGLFETGAGGSAPKHAQQLAEEGHLRWDSLGEFMALSASLEHFGQTTGNQKAKILADTLENATTKLLMNDKSPGKKAGELNNPVSHFYLAMYWAEALASQDQDPGLKSAFAAIAKTLADQEAKILAELLSVQGKPADIGGYYLPDEEKANRVMRSSDTFNRILN